MCGGRRGRELRAKRARYSAAAFALLSGLCVKMVAGVHTPEHAVRQAPSRPPPRFARGRGYVCVHALVLSRG